MKCETGLVMYHSLLSHSCTVQYTTHLATVHLPPAPAWLLPSPMPLIVPLPPQPPVPPLPACPSCLSFTPVLHTCSMAVHAQMLAAGTHYVVAARLSTVEPCLHYNRLTALIIQCTDTMHTYHWHCAMLSNLPVITTVFYLTVSRVFTRS